MQSLDKLGQSLDTTCPKSATFGQTGQTLKGCPNVQAGVLSVTLEQKLKSVTTLEELYGFANRRKVLQVDLPDWTPEERALIMQRKYELEQGKI